MRERGGYYVDTKLAEVGKPVGGYAVERIRVVDGINDTNDVCFSDFGLEVWAVLGSCWSVCE